MGDCVKINDRGYIVKRISLLYTVFENTDNNTTVQVANNTVGGLWVDNLSRSRAMQDRISFQVFPTTSMRDLELLRVELEKFVTDPDNSRDFKPDIYVDLISLGNLSSLELRIIIKHKSNFSNGPLYAYRRSKFNCALLSALRRIPIEGPAGSFPAQGSLQAPNYAVMISEDKAQEAKLIHDQGVEAKKVVVPVPIGGQDPPGTVVVSSGLEILPRSRPGEVPDEFSGEVRQRVSISGAPRHQGHAIS